MNHPTARLSTAEEMLDLLLAANGPLQSAGATDAELIATAYAEAARLHAAVDRAYELLVGVYRANIVCRGAGPVTRS